MLLVGSTPAIPRPLRKSRCQPAGLCVPWQVTHTKEVDGKIRLRFKLGWVSAFSADGYTTLMVRPSARKLTRATFLNPLTSPPGRPRAIVQCVWISGTPRENIGVFHASSLNVAPISPNTPQAENCPNKCYKALDDCVIRVDFDKSSDKAANPKLPKNKVIEVIESKELDDGSGVIRMQFQKGASPKRRAPRSAPRLDAWRRAKPQAGRATAPRRARSC